MLMTNGLGASVGVVAAQGVVNHFTANQTDFQGWTAAWLVFAGYALVVAVLFALVFKEKKEQ
jgi:NHS family nucleoside permease-like MFS transporter/NHS family xanthosine MFS transporter